METATKTIASFEALTPELSAPQGTLETDLGLPASLNAQFSDGVAGEIPVTWQCAAGYDPNAAAGGQFAFAAVLPEGYALLEGVSLPQILVTLTPPLANAMLAAESDEDWTLSDGKLTVTGYVGSDDISSFASAQSIEICEGAQLILQSDFSGTITVLRLGTLENDKTLSGAITVSEDGYFYNDGTISGGTISGDVSNYGTITDGDFTGATVTNTKDGTISGGTFTGATVYNDDGTISGGDFTEATVRNTGDATVTGGTFSNVAFDSTSGELTITGNVDLDEEDALAPLTIGLGDASIQSITVEASATFNAGDNTVSVPVTNRGTISGGTFSQLPSGDGSISGGAFEGAFEIADGMLSVTGEDVDLSNIDYANVKHVGINPGTSVSNANVPEGVKVDNFGAINGGTFAGEVMLLDTGTINNGTFTGTITGSGTINNGDFTQATFSNFTGTINGGTFGGYTISNTSGVRTLTITAPVEVTDDMLAGISTVIVAATGEITGGELNGDPLMNEVIVDVRGVISGGTFSSKMVVYN